jgi:hypothetical protein
VESEAKASRKDGGKECAVRALVPSTNDDISIYMAVHDCVIVAGSGGENQEYHSSKILASLGGGNGERTEETNRENKKVILSVCPWKQNDTVLVKVTVTVMLMVPVQIKATFKVSVSVKVMAMAMVTVSVQIKDKVKVSVTVNDTVMDMVSV